jgi:hypothetical protein
LLSPLDATFLELEDGDRSAHMHIGGVLVFDGPRARVRRAARPARGAARRATALPATSIRTASTARVGLDGARSLFDLALHDELAGAPHTSLNVPLGEHRRLTVTHAGLDRVKAIRATLGRHGERRRARPS